MSTMLYKSGGNTAVWGRNLHTKLVSEDDVEDHVSDGWYLHPHDVPEEDHGSDKSIEDMGEVSDGYHTFNELYAHRVRLFSTLMHAFQNLSWWSRKHSDGEEWEGWILAGITTPEGEVTYHLPESEIENLPDGTEQEFGKEWDGHSADDVLDRLITLRPEMKNKGTRKPKAEVEPKPQDEVIDEPDNES